jgi:hypothetical protein
MVLNARIAARNARPSYNVWTLSPTSSNSRYTEIVSVHLRSIDCPQQKVANTIALQTITA